MIASAKSFLFLGDGDYKLQIPFFQRDYVWKQENWSELLNTFLNENDTPFLGSIILKKADDSKIIIDGQQRLTTVTLLIKALYDLAPQKQHCEGAPMRKAIVNNLFYADSQNDAFDYDYKVKIEHSRIDRKDYETVIKNGVFTPDPPINLDTIDEKSSKILQCYKFFVEQIKELSKIDNDVIMKIHKNIFSNEKNTLVVIELDEKDINEQLIFDTINRAGEKLTSSDIIKNNLFKIGLDKCESVEKTRADVCKIYDDQWHGLFSCTAEERDIWDEQRTFGNNKKTNLEFLLYCVAAIKWGTSDDKKDKDKDIFSRLEVTYAENTKNYSYYDFLNLINEIKLYGQIYRNRIQSLHIALDNKDASQLFTYDDFVLRLLLILDKFGVQMFYPYVLKRIAESQEAHTNILDDETLKHDFWVLESFVVRRRLSGQGVTDYRIKCNKVLHNSSTGINCLIESDLAKNDSSLRDKKVFEYLKYIKKNDTANIILFCMELYKIKNPKNAIVSLPFDFTLEHIMPKKWEQNWSNIPYVNDDGTSFKAPEDEQKERRDEYVLNIGNMTLLKSKLNISVSNGSFSTKIQGDGTNEGYRNFTSLKLTSEIVESYNTGKITEWNECQIFKRSKELFELFKILWPTFEDQLDNNEDIDPDALLDEIVSNSSSSFINDTQQDENLANFIKYCNNKNQNLYAYKDILLLSILESSENGIISLDECTQYFWDFYEKRRTKGLTVEGKESFIVKQYPYTFVELSKEILAYPYDRFNRKGYMEYDKGSNTISIVPQIWNNLSTSIISDLIDSCKKGLDEHFAEL